MDRAAPIRVLHVVKGLGPGGAERLLVSMARAADPAAVRQEVAYVLDAKDHLCGELEALGVPTHMLADGRGMADLRWPWRLRDLARRMDVVHLHSPAVAAVARPVLRTLRRGPLSVSTEHNLWESLGAVTRTANALTLPLDEVRWAVSNAVVASAWRPWRAKTEVLVHGIPTEELRRRASERVHSRRALGWADDDVVVAIVANLRRHKDYPTLFAAAAFALETEPTLRFVSIGQGPLEGELRSHLGSLRLGDRFVMLGYHDDPPAVVAGADVFTLSSRHEGLPISLLEAMALGVPPVVTSAGGTSEVVTDAVDGLLVPPGEPRALSNAYVRLAREPDERRRLGRGATLRAADFDVASAARIVEARYRSLTAS